MGGTFAAGQSEMTCSSIVIHTYQVQRIDLKPLDTLQERCKLKLGQNDNLISSIDACMANDHQTIDMAHG